MATRRVRGVSSKFCINPMAYIWCISPMPCMAHTTHTHTIHEILFVGFWWPNIGVARIASTQNVTVLTCSTVSKTTSCERMLRKMTQRNRCGERSICTTREYRSLMATCYQKPKPKLNKKIIIEKHRSKIPRRDKSQRDFFSLLCVTLPFYPLFVCFVHAKPTALSFPNE